MSFVTTKITKNDYNNVYKQTNKSENKQHGNLHQYA